MPVGSLDLTALVLDFPEQPGVLDRQYRLGREGLQKVDHFGAKLPGRFSPYHQPADDPLFAQQRHGQAGAEAEALQHLAHARRVSALFENIGDLHWFTARCRSTYHSISQTRWIGTKRVDEFLFHMIRRPKQELFRLLVVFVNRPPVGAAQLDRMGNDSRQHGFEVERGAYRLTNFAQCSQLTYRLHQLPRPCFEFLEQPHVFNRNDRLVGEGLEQGNLLLIERTNFRAANHNDADWNTLSKQRSGKDSPSGCDCMGRFRELFEVCRDVMDVNHMAVDDSSAGDRATSDGPPHWRDWHRPTYCRSLEHLTIYAKDRSVLRITKPCGTFRHRIQHRLDVRG